MFDVRVIQSERAAGTGYYLLIIPPSTLRPHAVRQDRNLRYSRRDGTTTRWLSEPEVADAYRNRFTLASGHSERVEQILEEGFAAMDLTGDAFVGLAMVPTSPGSMTIDLARLREMEAWAREHGSPEFFGGFFPGGVSPTARAGVHRVTLGSLSEQDRRPHFQYVEFFDDGAGFACKRLMDPRTGPAGDVPPDTFVLNEALLWDIGRCLLVLGQHAVRRCGAWGDALVQARITGPHMRLAFMHYFGQGFGTPEPVAGGRERDEASSRRTVVLEAIAAISQPLCAAVRLVATDIFHAFGSPEVRQIGPDGALRVRYLAGDGELRRWAEGHGIGVSDETVPGE